MYKQIINGWWFIYMTYTLVSLEIMFPTNLSCKLVTFCFTLGKALFVESSFFFLHGKICLLGAVSVPSFDMLRHYFSLHIGHMGKRSHRDNIASDKWNVQHRLKFATWRYMFKPLWVRVFESHLLFHVSPQLLCSLPCMFAHYMGCPLSCHVSIWQYTPCFVTFW